MFRHQRIAVSLLLTVFGLSTILAACHRKQAEETQTQIFGRYTEQQFIDSCRPLITAILPDKGDIDLGDIYLITDRMMLNTREGGTRFEWHIHAFDGRGNQLVHIVRDADTGRICLASWGEVSLPASHHPHYLTESEAIAHAQSWMRQLEYADRWFSAGSPNHLMKGPIHHTNGWMIFLYSRTWKAEIILSESTNTLNFARITPLR